MKNELLTVLHRIERVASLIVNDKTNSRQWNEARAKEIIELSNFASNMVQEPLSNGEAS
jgi:hypothetical protein